MKMRWLLLLLLIPLPVMATTYNVKDNLVLGDIDANASGVVCERAKRMGFIQLQKELPCCIDSDKNGYCSNEERLLGSGRKIGLHMTYWWPTHSFSPSFSHKLMMFPCDGTSIVTGHEYSALLNGSGCRSISPLAFCCPDDVFPQVMKPKVTGSFYTPPKPDDTMILVVNKNRWALVEAGRYRDKFIEKAIRTEEARCADGGGDLFLWDEGYGSYFSNTRNYHEGDRVFMFSRPDYDITPLISWCV